MSLGKFWERNQDCGAEGEPEYCRRPLPESVKVVLISRLERKTLHLAVEPN